MTHEYEERRLDAFAELAQYGDLMLAVGAIPDRSMWDPAGVTAIAIKSMVLEGVTRRCFQVEVDEQGNPCYRAALTDLLHDDSDGAVRLVYKDGIFDGVDFDLDVYGRGRWHMRTDGLLAKVTDAGEKPLGKLATRLAYRHFQMLSVMPPLSSGQ